MTGIDALRASIGAANREILSQIWKYRLSTGEWIPIRLLHQQSGGKAVVRPQLELLGGSIIFETDEADTKYGLTFLGILLTSEGEGLETLMTKYLEYAHAKAMAEPLRKEVSSKEVETDLQLTPTETAELGAMLRFHFSSGGGFGPTEWYAKLPDDIEDLPQDILTHIRDIVLRDYDPQVPLASRDRSSYLLGRQKLEAIKKATPINSPEFKRQLLAQHISNLDNLKLQAAKYGSLDVPLRLLNQIEDEENEIVRLQAELEHDS